MKNKKLLLIIAAILIIAAFFLLSGNEEPGIYEPSSTNTELHLIEEDTPSVDVADTDPIEDNPQVLPEAPPETDPQIQEEPAQEIQEEPAQEPEEVPAIDEDGWYDSKDEVALFIHTYGKLPGNYITKKEAEKLGWNGGGLDNYAKGKSIGGSHFGNYEGILPEGHNYTECDIDTAGKKSRGAKRIVFSDDGLIYYTDDHYETFTLLYGNED